MEDEFHAIIKLVSGEEIFSLVSVDETNEENPFVILQNPVIMKLVNGPNGHFIKIKPWMELIEDELFIIKLDKIITISETKDSKLIAIYNHHHSPENNNNFYKADGSIKPNKDMGYISSVNDARQKLEGVYKINIEEKPKEI